MLNPDDIAKMLMAELTSGFGRSMTALVKEMSKDMSSTVRVEQGWPPSWNPKTNVVKLPYFVNADLLPERALHDGRSFVGHESGEKEFNTLDPLDPRWKDKAMLKTIVNIVGDARINVKREAEYPGFKRSHAITCDAFLTDYKAQAQMPQYDEDQWVDDCKAYATALCLAEFEWEGYTRYSELMSIPNMNPKVEKALKVLKPFMDRLRPESMSCEEIADESVKIYDALKCYDIPEDKQMEAFGAEGEEGEEGDEEGEGGGGWGKGGRDYGDKLANSLIDGSEAPLCSGDHYGYGNVNVYSFDPTIDKWITYESPKENKVGTYQGIDLDRLAMVLANRLIKLLQTPAPVTARYQDTGRMDGSRISAVLQYKTNVFKRKIIAEDTDVSVAISVDCSSSMSSIGRDVRAAIATWSKSLGLVGIPHEILGWYQRGYGWGHNDKGTLPNDMRENLYRYTPITWQVIKAFHEDYKVGVYRAQYQMTFSGGTPSGEGVSVPGWRLMQRREPRRLLLIFTDGAPALTAHGPGEVHHRYIKDSIEALRRRGIEVVGVALNTGCFYSVEDMFGPDQSMCIDGVGELMTRQGNAILRRVIGHAEMRGSR
jgi:hypothetical protein